MRGRAARRYVVGADAASPLGDIRSATAGETIWLGTGATRRADWPRYADALMVALTRGASICWHGEDPP